MMRDVYSKVKFKPALQDDIQGEINRLTVIIPDIDTKIRMLELEIESIQKNLGRFLNRYYDEVGSIYEQVKAKGSSDLDNQDYLDIDEQDLLPQNESSVLLEHEIKSLYRKLVRLCHPDSAAEGGNEVELFSEVTRAYQEKNLHHLLKLEKVICQNDPVNLTDLEALSKLTDEYDAAMTKHSALLHKKQELIHSPAYILQRKVFLRSLDGGDLIAEIKEDLLKILCDM